MRIQVCRDSNSIAYMIGLLETTLLASLRVWLEDQCIAADCLAANVNGNMGCMNLCRSALNHVHSRLDKNHAEQNADMGLIFSMCGIRMMPCAERIAHPLDFSFYFSYFLAREGCVDKSI